MKKLPGYRITGHRDLSHYGAKRYGADLFIKAQGNELSRETIKEIIQEVTGTLINCRYYRSKITQEYFKNKQADVVWLRVFARGENKAIARTLYLNPELPKDMAPLGLERVDEKLGNIDIIWLK